MRKRMDAGGATCAKVIHGARASRLLLTADQLLGGEGGGHENAKVFRGNPDGDASPSGGGAQSMLSSINPVLHGRLSSGVRACGFLWKFCKRRGLRHRLCIMLGSWEVA